MTSEAPGGRLLTYRQVGQLLGVGERAALNWVKEQDLLITAGRPAKVALADVVARAEALGRPLPGLLGVVSEGVRADSEHFGIPDRQTPEHFGSPSEAIEAAYRVEGETPPVALVPLATMVEELRGLAGELTHLAERNEALALEVGSLRAQVAGHRAQLAAKDETLATQRETIAELRHRADVAEQEAATLRARFSPPVVAQDEPKGDRRTPETSHAEGGPGAGLWGRVRRWWVGES